MSSKSKKTVFILGTILILGAFLRFFNLSWGNGYYFHPDENNIARSILHLSWPQLDPHFYAYGQFSPYLAYFSAQAKQFFSHSSPIKFSEAIFFLRFWSAVSSLASVYLLYLIGQKLLHFSFPFSFLPPLFLSFAPGLIQAAHFGTTESLLTFFFIAILYFSLRFLHTQKKQNLFLAGICSGLAIGTKISGATFLAAPLAAILIHFAAIPKNKKKTSQIIFLLFFLIIPTILFTFLSSPYLIIHHQKSWPILKYEISIAKGKIPIFYTRQFQGTKPYIFQIKKIFPYALGWPLFVLGAGGFLWTMISLTKNFLKKGKTKNKLDIKYWILDISFLAYFLYYGHLFVKWTRFMTPILPFFALFATYVLEKTYHHLSLHMPRALLNVLFAALIFLSLLPGMIFFFRVYARPDTRFTASQWIYKHLPQDATILSEGGNVVNLPLAIKNPPYQTINFDFYRLDQDPSSFPRLTQALSKADYILIPSRRVYANHLRLPQQFPLTSAYYKLLFSERLGFTLLKKFTLLNDNKAEETWSVFDHPQIIIYQKRFFLSPSEYQTIIQEKADSIY